MSKPDIELYKCGDFFEAFGESANVLAELFGLTVTTVPGPDNSPIQLAGIPYHGSHGYWGRLTEAGHDVVLRPHTSAPEWFRKYMH